MIDLKKGPVVIKWTNRNSGETGYVKRVDGINKCFENTYDKSEAKTYGNKGGASAAVRTLMSYGEGENNDFEYVDA